MNLVQKLLTKSAAAMDLPVDIAADLPHIDLLGGCECAVEPHKGLLAYSQEEIVAATSIGPIYVCGKNLQIKLMNKACLIIKGRIQEIRLSEEHSFE